MSGKNHRILVVDDDVAMCKLITRVLDKDGHAVTSANNGGDALTLLQRERYDVVILDVGLPDISGLDILSSWRGRNGTKIIMITADDTAETLMSAIRNDAYLYIRKPFAPEQLRD